MACPLIGYQSEFIVSWTHRRLPALFLLHGLYLCIEKSLQDSPLQEF